MQLQKSFEQVAMELNTEFIAELWWHPDFGYTWYFPEQRAGHAWVRSRHEEWLEMPFSGAVKAGEFHSHGRIPPFFSGIDDHDEIMIPGIYGVFGSAGGPNAGWRFRVVEDGVSYMIPEDVMTGLLDRNAVWQESLVRQLLSEDRKARLRNEDAADVPKKVYSEVCLGDVRMLLMPAYEAWWWGRFPAFHAVKVGGGDISPSDMLTSEALLLKAEDAGISGGYYSSGEEKSITDFFFT